MTPQLQATLAKLPTKPGVYLLKDDRGRVLYVGKAQSLRNRVRQYWQAGRGGTAAPLRIETAIDRVADIEWT
ncbi:MAG: GIY-YIG nuclease family protein, partial [Mycobacterium sp.]